MWMCFFVLNNPDQLYALLDNWEKAGISGVTIIESTGIHRVMTQQIPARYFFGQSSRQEEGHYTLLAIVPDEETVKKAILASEEITGDLSLPDTGIFAAWPISHIKGLPRQGK